MCPIDPYRCGCIGHIFPGVDHLVACCDKPHITTEEYMERRGSYSGYWTVPEQKDVWDAD